MQSKTKIILIIIVLLLVAGAVYYFFQKYQEQDLEDTQDLGSQIFNKIKGPVERIPETNPFNKLKLNPFE